MNTNDTPLHRRILVINDNLAIHQDFRKIFDPPKESETALSEAESLFVRRTGSRNSPGLNFKSIPHIKARKDWRWYARHGQEDRPYAMAFVDIRMPPGWDGIETTVKIWEQDPEVQIVICTAYSDYSWDDMVASLPKSDQLLVLKKPFDTIEALQMTHALTEKWRLHQAVKFKLEHLQLNVDMRTKVLEMENAKLRAEIDSLRNLKVN